MATLNILWLFFTACSHSGCSNHRRLHCMFSNSAGQVFWCSKALLQILSDEFAEGNRCHNIIECNSYSFIEMPDFVSHIPSISSTRRREQEINTVSAVGQQRSLAKNLIIVDAIYNEAELQYKFQRTISTILPVSLFSSYQSTFSQICECPSGGGFREFQIFGDGGNGRPADAVFIGAVSQVDVHGDCPVGQIHLVELCEIAQIYLLFGWGLLPQPCLFFVHVGLNRCGFYI